MNEAEQLAKDPTREVNDAVTAAQKASAASDSLAEVQLIRDDGSCLVVSSRQGSDPLIRPFGSRDEALATDLGWDHLTAEEQAEAEAHVEEQETALAEARGETTEPVEEGSN